MGSMTSCSSSAWNFSPSLTASMCIGGRLPSFMRGRDAARRSFATALARCSAAEAGSLSMGARVLCLGMSDEHDDDKENVRGWQRPTWDRGPSGKGGCMRCLCVCRRRKKERGRKATDRRERSECGHTWQLALRQQQPRPGRRRRRRCRRCRRSQVYNQS